MKLIQIPRLGEQYFEERLQNGLLLRVIPKKDFAKKYAFLAVNFGSIDTDFVLEGKEYHMPAGIAHYLEHKMFDLPDENATNLFAANGASPNAFTSYAMTAYYFSCTEKFEENLQILLRMVLTPYFTEETVEKERGIIAQEIKMYEDSASSRVFEALFENVFTEHPVRVPIAGTVESIGQITAQMLYDCHRAFYQPANMMLCVVGDVDENELCGLVQKYTPEKNSPVPVRNYGNAESVQCKAPKYEATMSVSMPTFAIGFKSESAGSGEDMMRMEIVGDLAAEILCGESSALYSKLYDEGLIDSDLSAGFENVKDACMLSVSGDSTDPEAVLDAIVQEAQRIKEEGFDYAQFERLLKSAIGRRTRDLDSFESVSFRNCAYHFDDMDYYRFPDVYASVTAEAVAEFISRVVCRERASIAIIRPKEEG